MVASTRVVFSDLHRTELLRAARLAGPQSVHRAECLLAATDLLVVDPEVFDAAATVEPSLLRSLDPLHLAAAGTAPTDLEAVAEVVGTRGPYEVAKPLAG